MPYFLGCKQQAEFDLNPETAKFVSRGRDSFREFSTRLQVGERLFKVVFELDWDGSLSAVADLLDAHFIPDPPIFAKDERRPNPK